jgi:MscS family membrane protein
MQRKILRFFRIATGIAAIGLTATCGTIAQTTNAPETAAATAAATSTGTATNASKTPKPPSKVEAFLENNQTLVTFGLDRVRLLQTPILGNPLWKYLASGIYLILAFYFSKLIDLVIANRLKKWAAKTTTRWDDVVIDLVHGPIKIISFVILLHIGLRIFSWPAWVEDYLSKGLQLVVAASLTYMALRVVDLLMLYLQKKTTADADKTLNEQLHPIVRKSLKTFIVIVAVLFTSQNLGVNITSILASLSIGGLALGLAAQDTLANLFGAVAVYVDKPFQIGDSIRLENGLEGAVEAVGWRSTRVRHLDGYLITIPNKTMGSATITNLTRRPNIKTEWNIGLVYETSNAQLRRALALLEDLFRKHPMTFDVTINFNRFAESALNIQVVHWWRSTDTKAYQQGLQQFNLAIKEKFEAAGLKMAFPTRTVLVKPNTSVGLEGSGQK